MPDTLAAPATPSPTAKPTAPATTPSPTAKSTVADQSAPANDKSTPATTELPAAVDKVDPAKKEAERRAAAVARAKRIEADNRKTEERIKSERLAFDSEKQALKEAREKAEKYDRYEKLRAENPLKWAEEQGITRQQLLDQMIAGNKQTPEQIAEAAAEKIFKEREAKYLAEHAAQQKQLAEEVVAQTKVAVNKLAEMVKNDPDKFEFCGQDPQAADKAWKVIESYWVETSALGRPELLDYSEALETVEASLEENFNAFLGKSKKLAAKKAAAEAEKVAAEKKVEEASVAADKTKGERKTSLFKDYKPEVKISVPDDAQNSIEAMYKVGARRKRLAEIKDHFTKPKE